MLRPLRSYAARCASTAPLGAPAQGLRGHNLQVINPAPHGAASSTPWRLCAAGLQVFGTGLFPELESSPLIAALEGNYAASIREDVVDKLGAAQQAKRAATLASRQRRLSKQSARYRAQLAALQGRPAMLPVDTPAEL